MVVIQECPPQPQVRVDDYFLHKESLVQVVQVNASGTQILVEDCVTEEVYRLHISEIIEDKKIIPSE